MKQPKKLTIISQKDAKAAGLSRFFTGRACRRGHIAERMTAGGTCHECLMLRQRAMFESETHEELADRMMTIQRRR